MLKLAGAELRFEDRELAPEATVVASAKAAAMIGQYFGDTLKDRMQAVNEGDVLEMAGLTIHVMHTPGHTEGSVCLLVDDVIFSGDTLFCHSCGRTDLPGGDPDAIMRSLGRLKALEGWRIPEDFDYASLPGLRNESRMKLQKIRPSTLAQAGRIDGVTPSELSLLQVFLNRLKKQEN